MCKEIVRLESPEDPGERSRLWSEEDIVQVLEEYTGTSRIEIICMDYPSLDVRDKLSVCKLPRSLLKSFESPSSLKRFINMKELNLDYCGSLKRILDVSGCKSLTSSCRSMLLNKELHEAGKTNFRMTGNASHAMEVDAMKKRWSLLLWS
ncbi:hypothetical protein P8452_55849 [Trifolium repens]|nr:hypothetical protein P8452_55849 [Trifolium repens]